MHIQITDFGSAKLLKGQEEKKEEGNILYGYICISIVYYTNT